MRARRSLTRACSFALKTARLDSAARARALIARATATLGEAIRHTDRSGRRHLLTADCAAALDATLRDADERAHRFLVSLGDARPAPKPRRVDHHGNAVQKHRRARKSATKDARLAAAGASDVWLTPPDGR